jgi:uncharacterized damage-inducible protein DinB
MARASAELIPLARYNAWANGTVFALCSALAPDELVSARGYAPVLETLNHLVHVQSNFLRLSRGEERVRPPAEFAALRERSRELDAEYVRFLESGPDLERTFHVPWFGFDVTVREAMLQALTHSLKHRSDVCFVLGRLGREVPGTDYIQWLAESRSGS